jgi:hypothetical protein
MRDGAGIGDLDTNEDRQRSAAQCRDVQSPSALHLSPDEIAHRIGGLRRLHFAAGWRSVQRAHVTLRQRAALIRLLKLGEAFKLLLKWIGGPVRGGNAGWRRIVRLAHVGRSLRPPNGCVRLRRPGRILIHEQDVHRDNVRGDTHATRDEECNQQGPRARSWSRQAPSPGPSVLPRVAYGSPPLCATRTFPRSRPEAASARTLLLPKDRP